MDDVEAELLVALGLPACVLDGVLGADECDAAAGHIAVLGRRPRRVQRVLHEILALLHGDLGGAADLDDRHASGELGVTLHQLLLVVVAGGLVPERHDLIGAGLDVALLAGALDDGRVVLGDDDLLGPAEFIHLDRVEASAEVFGEECAAGEHGDVAEHRLAPVAEAGRLDRTDFERAAETVDDQRRQGLVLDVLGDEQQRLVGGDRLVQQRQQVRQVRDLLLVDEDEAVLEDALGGLGVGHEVRREVALVELHALDVLERGVGTLAVLDLDHAVGPDLVDGLGDHLGDLGVVV